MLKASELRIGNYVEKHNYGTTGNTIERVNGAYMSWVEKDESKCYGIPITPEILIKCGFAYKENIAHWANCDDDLSYYFIELPTGRQLEIYTEDYSCNFLEGKEPVVKFLHQLQNLYFALTGQELEINLLQTPNADITFKG